MAAPPEFDGLLPATGPLAQNAPFLAAGVALGIFVMGVGLARAWSETPGRERPDDGDAAAASRGLPATRALLAPGAARLRATFARLPASARAHKVAQRLLHAGSPYGWGVGQFTAVRLAAGIAGCAIGAAAAARSGDPGRGPVLSAALAALGYLLPGLWLGQRTRARQRAILRALPDALDLLSIGVEAGLGLDSAFAEVVDRWDTPLSGEFAVMLAELRLGRGRKEALRGLAHRTGVPEVRNFAAALIQADELGMGIARPLATQARRLRAKRRQHAERLAREASVKMVAVMAALIMPALFILILAPAILQLQAAFRR